MRGLLCFTVILFLWGGTAFAVQFDHAAHLDYVGGDCMSCHMEDAETIVPDRDICAGCHDEDFVAEVTFPGTKTHDVTWALQHGPAARGEFYDCAACHQQSYCLECHKSGFADEQGSFSNSMLNVHRSDFHVTHPIAARTDQQLCASCHENQFCVECHNQFDDTDLAIVSHRLGFSNIRVGSSGPAHATFTDSQCVTCHKDPNITEYKPLLFTDQWHSEHAREARKNLATCQACHPEGDICLKCHSARSGLRVNPHPEDWGDIDDRLLDASDGRTCRKCH